jgi:uncharacterized lipoprotein YehR (DUF1307 family)
MELLYVNTPSLNFKSTEEQLERVSDFFHEMEGNKENIEKVVYVDNYTVEKGILEYAQKHQKDLIIMATHGRKGLGHLFYGSVSEDVVNHSRIPVVTFKI